MSIQLSGNGAGILMPKKLILPVFTVFFISLFASCKKEIAPSQSTDALSNSLTAQESSMAITTSSTNFGALISGSTTINDEITICQKLGVKYVRYAIILKDFTGVDKGYEKWVNAGYKVLLNLNYDNVTSNTGKRSPVPFPTDMVQYRSLLTKVLDKYQPEIAVIENEPCTDQFHSGPIEDYITELKTAVDVCNKRGIAVADGGLHVDYVELVMSGWASKTANSLETQKLIAAYKTMNLTYVNTHVASPFNSNQNVYPVGTLENDADYLRTQTGKPVICNEYNQNSTSTTLMTGTVGGFKAGNYKYVITRSGSGTDGGASLNQGTSLTSLGKAYRDAIQ
ncbi:hypothetical protein FRZ67_17700 [Panacibacter ginsenosidivorans]|uniref:Glycoside hydrolase family 5 domain-containing protein n=1 Tax=Panacibacter ginsenosidivorans TaxID=1813871 RepID=A0A5B8VDC9_9BACT|nr:hypothetical protein [Panacibacter ginsenosidivorans]QEC69055.1 hypothetical protein FRZ67_17700 [Panacibacter ginsenosidivorans]